MLLQVKICKPDKCKFADICQYCRPDIVCGKQLNREAEIHKYCGSFIYYELFYLVASNILWLNIIDKYLALQDPNKIYKRKYSRMIRFKFNMLKFLKRFSRKFEQREPETKPKLEEYINHLEKYLVEKYGKKLMEKGA